MKVLALTPAALRGLRLRPMTLVGPLIVVAFAVAAFVVAISVVVAASAGKSTEPVRYRAADVVVVVEPTLHIQLPEDSYTDFTPPDPVGLDADAVRRLAEVPGADAAVADYTSPGALSGGRAASASERRRDHQADDHPVATGDETTVIRGWESLRLADSTLVDGAAPGAGEIAVPAGRGLDVGDRAELLTPGGRQSVTVSALVEDPGAEQELSVLVDDATAADLAGHRAAAVGLFGSGDPDDLQAAVKRDFKAPAGLKNRMQVLTGDDRARAEVDRRAVVLADTVAVAGVVMSVSGFVALFTTANTFALGVARRRGEFAVLRLVGATRRQVRASVLLEALFVALAGGVLGLLLGPPLTAPFVRLLVDNDLAPKGFTAPPSPLALAIAAGAAGAVALLAAYGGSRRASKIRPVEAVAEAGADVRRPGVVRLVFGVLCIGTAVVVSMLLPTSLEVVLAGAVMLSWLVLIGLGAIGPVIVPPVAAGLLRFGAGLRKLVGRPGALAELPQASSRRAVRRTAATAMPIAITVGLCATMLGITDVAVAASNREAADAITADQVVVPGPSGLLDRNVAGEFADIDGVRAAMPLRTSEIVAGSPVDTFERSAWLVDPATLTEVTALPTSSGDLADLGPGTIALSTQLADAMGDLAVGDTARFRGPDGRPTTARVVALLDLPMLSVESVLPYPDAAVTRYADRVLVSYDRGLDAAGRDRAAAAVAKQAESIGASAAPAAELSSAQAEAQAGSNKIVIRIILAIAVLLGAVSLVNSVLMSVEDRRREAAVLRLVGADRSQVRSWILTECFGVVLAGLLLGLAVYAVIAVPMVLNQPALGRLPAPPVTDVWVVGGALTLIAFASTALAAAALGRVSPSAAQEQ
jgi:putative ABC transport system permease protein